MSGFPVPNPVDSYWQLPPHSIANHRTTRSLPSSVDCVIVGSGVTGATAALKLLARDASSVLMLEARTAASAASGRNGGHCRTGWWSRFKKITEQFGEDEALRVERLEEANVKSISDYVRTHAVDCDFKDVTTSSVFLTQQRLDAALDVLKFREEVSKRRKDAPLAIEHKVLAGQEAHKEFGTDRIAGAVTFPAHTQNPYRLVCHMLELAVSKGLNLQTNTTASRVEKAADGTWRVQTDRGVVTAKKVVLATNAYTNALHPGLAETNFVVTGRSQVAAIRPGSKASGLPALRDKSAGLSDFNGGDYFFCRAEGLSGAGDVLFGGGQHITMDKGCTDDSNINGNIAKYLHQAAGEFFGSDVWGEDGDVVRDWVGITCYTPDGFPVIGEVPGQKGLYMAVGYNGHGSKLICARLQR